jgi:hypothetical protein
VFSVKYLIHFRVFLQCFLTSCSIFEGGVSISFKLCHSQLVLDKVYSFQLPLFVSEIINNNGRQGPGGRRVTGRTYVLYVLHAPYRAGAGERQEVAGQWR